MNRTLLTSAVCTLAGALIASAQVPSLINYQGRLTDANGAPVTGSKTFAINIYDAATAGNLLYSESIGAVTLDSNGVYSFQFGNSGTSNTQVTETIGTTAGSTLSYTKTLSSTPVVANSITVTDGTNSWSQSVGNPGTGATATANTISGFVIGATITNGGSGYTGAPAVTITGSGSGAAATATISGGVVTGITITSAGSGYTGGATITIAPPVIPFRVDYSGGAITATYSSAPTVGQSITATYRYGTSGITGALAGAAEHWMAISVEGVVQGTRQRVLAVPFAINAAVANRAESLADRPVVIKPDVFYPIFDIIASYNNYAPLGLPVSGNCFTIVPSSLKRINSINITYFVNYVDYWGWPNSSSVKIELIKSGVDGVETVEKTFIANGSPEKSGEFSEAIPLDVEMDFYSKYWVRVTMSRVTRSTNYGNPCYVKMMTFGGIW